MILKATKFCKSNLIAKDADVNGDMRCVEGAQEKCSAVEGVKVLALCTGQAKAELSAHQELQPRSVVETVQEH